ncbi:MAG: hypothetical protein IH846_08010, partial [Acidobacteria bacterium]|nr:hypothetical protein [Acidobacteriota bacterium]
RRATRKVSQEELQRQRRMQEEVGRNGEELVCQHLFRLKAEGSIRDFTWTSDSNAIAPYDFLVVLHDGQEIVIDVKSISGEFERPIHISSAELKEMTGRPRYDLYRVLALQRHLANSEFRRMSVLSQVPFSQLSINFPPA